ncbi:Serine/threonine-protein kinase cdc7 [Melia azedarach]|uniref:Serine/threonine-protein kinase cdc7 n=1 Tax=Melia azedarach TaxID=155640 RepID=A0ACC1XVB8_MELAZ|nr:Serine/threonine-protein kinase cdc7 [Melia azedarach]
MAEFQSMYQFVLLLVLISCHAIFSTEGRKIKSIHNKDAISSTEGIKETFPPFSYGESAAVIYKEDFLPTKSGSSPGIGHSFAQDKEDVKSKVLNAAGHSVAGIKDDLHPTAP